MVSNSAKRDADNSGNHVDLRPLKNSAIAWSNGSTLLKFLLITQHEVPLINTSEEQKRLSFRTENGKCTNVTNRRSRLRLVHSILQQYMFVDWAHCKLQSPLTRSTKQTEWKDPVWLL